jgi:hypothetical protein
LVKKESRIDRQPAAFMPKVPAPAASFYSHFDKDAAKAHFLCRERAGIEEWNLASRDL